MHYPISPFASLIRTKIHSCWFNTFGCRRLLMVNFELPSAVFSFKKAVARSLSAGSCDCHFKIGNELFTSVTWSLGTRNQPYQYMPPTDARLPTTSLRTFPTEVKSCRILSSERSETSKELLSIKRGKAWLKVPCFNNVTTLWLYKLLNPR